MGALAATLVLVERLDQMEPARCQDRRCSGPIKKALVNHPLRPHSLAAFSNAHTLTV